jgi:MFS family permease
MQHRDFRLLWAGRIVSTLGARMQLAAVGWQVYELTGSEFALGATGLFSAVAAILFSLLGGALADAMDRRRLLLITQPILMLNGLALALLTIYGAVTVPLIYAFVFVTAAAQALDNPARQAIVPGLVPRDHLMNAFAWDITGTQAAALAGPALAGFAIAEFGVGTTYLCYSASFLAIIGALVLIRVRVAPGGRRPGIEAVVEGLRFVRRHQIALPVMLLDFFAMFFGSAVALLPVYAKEILDVGAQGYGWLYSAEAIGGAIGAAIMIPLGTAKRPGLPLVLSVIAFGVCSAAFGLSRNFWLSMVFLAGTGAADTVSMVMRRSIIQLSTPDELRGRVTSANMIFVLSGPQLGQLESGAVAQLASPTASVVSGGLGAILAAIIIAARVPAIRKYRSS